MHRKVIRWCAYLLCAVLLLSDITTLAVWGTQSQETTENKEQEDPALSIPITTNDIKGWPAGPIVKEYSAVLIEAETGTILYDKQMHEKRYPASTTKIMTTLLALENSKMDEIVTFTETGMEAAYGGSSNIIPVLGEQFTMENCLYMIMLKSANDVSNQVAEHVGGSLEQFVQMMNDRAAKLGCKNTHFTNPSGLPDENHYTTAYDLALIMQEALKNEEFRKIIGTTKVVIPATNMTNGARTYANHHHMILDGEYTYEGTIGGKTGFTDAARNTLVTAAKRNEMTLIAVALKVYGRQCFTDTISLMDYGFNNFTKYNLEEKTEDKSGTIILPNTADIATVSTTDLLEQKEDGNTKEYSYNGQKVGEGILKKELKAREEKKAEQEAKAKEEAARVKAQEEAKKQKEDKEKKVESKGKKKVNILAIIIGILVTCILIVVGFMIFLYFRAKRIRRIRRQRRLKRMQELNKRKL